MEETQVSYDVTSELLQKYGSVRKAVDFTSLNNGIPLLFWTALLPILWIITYFFYKMEVHQDLSLLNIFLIAVYFF
jgi:hypothetical protein